jgi:hypothetical protein
VPVSALGLTPATASFHLSRLLVTRLRGANGYREGSPA